MLEILDQSTARKTRHQSKGTNKQARQTAKEDPGMQKQLTKQSRPNTQGGKQTNKDNTRGKRDREGRERGGDAPPRTGPETERERQKRKRSTNSGKRDNKPSKDKGGVRH